MISPIDKQLLDGTRWQYAKTELKEGIKAAKKEGQKPITIDIFKNVLNFLENIENVVTHVKVEMELKDDDKN